MTIIMIKLSPSTDYLQEMTALTGYPVVSYYVQISCGWFLYAYSCFSILKNGKEAIVGVHIFYTMPAHTQR